ncbi:zymogen granule membrane protein 16-like [Nerophis ophidion]|uniref:zymogen granule membrane protein 16-like n=1 Tax=Nerophis ophidion TaxID=159077 RepID=UPI002ADFCE8F|nr:zymogen granule membrane protein 16-like [Nerophis ophidion]XP_061772267.1 zymogen granule membrane protein 16-like [Nerophis ophidion]XP_061772268.1 zymogen granule membrane protein 16-like [Nerophis ophidion]
MIVHLFLCMLCTTCLAQLPFQDHYSFSPTVGSGSGTSFATQGTGRITAVRVWELNSAYIVGLQLRYDYIWTNQIGRTVGQPLEMILHPGEKIIQVSGKYFTSNFIYQLIFVTSTGRSLIAGQPTQTSFNFYPTYPDAELRILSGRFNGAGITGLGAHWGLINPDGAVNPNSTSTG